MNEVLPLIDPERVPDIFAEGLASIETIGRACVRFTLYATRDMGDGEIDRLVVARIIAPLPVVPIWVAQTSAFLAGRPFLHAVALEAAN